MTLQVTLAGVGLFTGEPCTLHLRSTEAQAPVSLRVGGGAEFSDAFVQNSAPSPASRTDAWTFT